MTALTRQERLVDTFATLADTLVVGYDVVDLLQTLVERCREVLDVTAAGILLADGNGELDVVASTSEAVRLVELMQLSAAAGPCVDCFTSGQIVSLPDIDGSPPRWERFRASALEQGFASAFAVPLRLRETTIGTLNLLREQRGELGEADVRAAQALADVATIGILHERMLRESDAVREQLQGALNSRVVIEQAKGVLAHTHRISLEEAFDILRSYSRSRSLRLADVARAVVQLELTI
ncbi:GAF and ANTAR domain-containing protein [Leifsonia poae]|uniref:GAF and ANTAR domain-containing protein n=1 Tax=Leifsonia poae TaxID=110933 RepID=UPI001CBC9991|nr:GAF and ANTAR domain-containing protein [Leifsonia poae]